MEILLPPLQTPVGNFSHENKLWHFSAPEVQHAAGGLWLWEVRVLQLLLLELVPVRLLQGAAGGGEAPLGAVRVLLRVREAGEAGPVRVWGRRARGAESASGPCQRGAGRGGKR